MITAKLTANWPASLQLIVGGYLANHGLELETMLPADLALVLLRVADSAIDDFVREEALGAFAGLTGRSITKCPSAMPPWPPKPLGARPKGFVFTRVLKPYPGHQSRGMAARYDEVKVGMTKDEALARGITKRDLRYWQEKQYVQLTERT